MSEAINTALLVMGVGMGTVFAILGLVVLSGEILIRIVNQYYPEEVKNKLASDERAFVPNTNTEKKKTSKIAAMIAAIDLATNGKGRVVKIEKINK